MAGLADIRMRIASVKNTQKITKAMKMVSAAKLRRAQERIINLRPFARGLQTAIADVVISHRVSHPLLSTVENPKKVLVVVITSDRGLCGGFNANISKYAYNYYLESKDKYEVLDFIYIGKRGADFFKRRDVKAKDVILNLAKEVSMAMASNMAETIKSSFSDGHYDEVKIIYNEFKSAIAQEVVCETLLPVDISYSEIDNDDHGFARDIIFEPSPEEMIDDLLEKHFSTQVYRCMSESVASEHGARMTAMDSSTNNANDMIESMTLTYNKLRQEAITTELTEIVSGAESLKG